MKLFESFQNTSTQTSTNLWMLYKHKIELKVKLKIKKIIKKTH